MKTHLSHQRGWVEKRHPFKNSKEVVFLLRWYVRDSESRNGWKKKSETLRGCSTKKQAKVELEKRMQSVNRTNSSPGENTNLSFERFLRGPWEDYLDSKQVKPSTRSSYDSMLKNYLMPLLGELPMREVTPLHVSEVLRKLRRKGLSQKYQRNAYALLKIMFEIAVEHDLVAVTPVRKKLHRPKVERQEKPKLFEEQFKRLFAEIPGYWKPLFFCVAVTGLRAGELLALRWTNFDPDTQKLHISHSLWKKTLVKPKTEASQRFLYVPEALLSALLLHKSRSTFTEPDNFIFCREDGSPCDPDYLRKHVLYLAMDRAGIERGSRTHGFHLFRHTAGSIVHEKTGSVKLAQTHLGHARLDTTANTYVHVDDQQNREAAEAVAGVIQKFCPLSAHSEPIDAGQIQ